MPKCVDEDDIGAVADWSDMLRSEGIRGLLGDSFGEAGGEASDSMEASDGSLGGVAKSLVSTELSGMPGGGEDISKFVEIVKRRAGYQELDKTNCEFWSSRESADNRYLSTMLSAIRRTDRANG